MAFKNLQILKSQEGQSVVEYILLLVVLMSLVATVFNSDRFRQFLGPNSDFFAAVRRSMEYSYRHGLQGLEDNSDYNNNHETYFNNNDGQTRFFIPLEPYPTQ